jgi:hypothetical protein
MSARILEVTEAQYHADPCERPSLSHSIAHTLVTRSPRHAWLEHPRLGGQQRVATKAMDEGSVLHRLLLDAGADFDVLAFDDWRTKDARAERDDSVARGRIPLLVKDFERLHEAAKCLKQNAANQGFPLGLPGARSELSIEFTEQVEQDHVLCRCRIDQARADHVLYDLKKVRSANPKDLERIIVASAYDIQAETYTRGYEQLVPEALGRSDFVFLFCETEPPYEVVPARLDGALREIGKRRWEKAVRLWRQLLAEGSWPWPGYVDGAVILAAPAWVMSQELPEEFL